MQTRHPTRAKLLTEARRLGMILLEARVDFLKTNYLPRIEKALPSLDVPPPVAHDLDAVAGDTQADKVFNYVIGWDPDPTKRNAQWLLNLVLAGARGVDLGMKLEDGYKATRYLELFAKARPRLPVAQRDLGRYRRLGDLFAVLKQFDRSNGDGEQAPDDADPVIMSRREEERLYDREMHEQAEVIYNGPDYKVLIPKTQAASCYFGRNTEWCSAATTSTNYFKVYNDQGPLYIILDKANNRRWQMHFESNQFMDETDRPVDRRTFVQQHPKVAAIFEQIEGAPLAEGLDMSWWRADAREDGAIFASAHRKGIVLQSGRGLLRQVALTVSEAPDGGLHTEFTARRAWPPKPVHEEIIAALNHVGVEGNSRPLAELEIYNGNGRWGSLAEVGSVLFRFRDGARWVAVNVDDHLTDLMLIDAGSRALIRAKMSTGGHFHVINLGVRNKDVVGDHLVDLMLAHREIKQWTSPSMFHPKENTIVPGDLTAAQALRLVDGRPDLCDFQTIFKAKGDTPETRAKAMEQLEEQSSDHTKDWIGDRLVIARYDNVLDLAEDIVAEKTGRRGRTNWIIDIVRGDEHYEIHGDPGFTDDEFKRMLRELPAADREALGRHLAKVHPDVVDELFEEDYDPNDADHVWQVIDEADDDEIKSALRSAGVTGLEVGINDEVHQFFEKAVQNNRYVLFQSEGDKWTGTMAHDTPCVFAIPLSRLALLIDEADGWGIKDYADDLEARLNLEEPHYGFNDYNREAAVERLADELHGIVSANAA